MDFYNQTVKNNKGLEIIQMSQDYEIDGALEWSRDAKLTWPIVLLDDQQTTALTKFAERGLPHYILISNQGKVIAQGLDDSMRHMRAVR